MPDVDTSISPPTLPTPKNLAEHGQRSDLVGPCDGAAGTSSVGHATASHAPLTHTGDQTTTALVISLQSLLGQFALPQVRADFVNGRFSQKMRRELLPKLDEVRCCLFPRWHGKSIISAVERNVGAAQHLLKLMSRDKEAFVTNLSDIHGCLTYEEWFSFLETLASDPYWDRVPVNDRCAHILPHGAKGDASTASTGDQSPPGPMRKSSRTVKRDVEVKIHRTKPRNMKRQPTKHRDGGRRSTKIEEIILSSSDDSDSSTEGSGHDDQSSTDCESSNSSSSDTTRRSRRRRRRNKCSRDKREAVMPPVFKMSGKTSLKSFLACYESYFSKKYNGDQYDKTQMLAQFLSDDLLEIFEVRGGRNLKYKDMKNELLNYYRKEKIGGKSYWRSKLDEATPDGCENLRIYGMKLLELAELAYPNDKKESAYQVRKHFLKTIPADASEKIEESELLMRASGSKKKHMSFANMMELAHDRQKASRKSMRLMLASAKMPLISHHQSTSREPVNSTFVGGDRGLDDRSNVMNMQRPNTRSSSTPRVYANSDRNSRIVCGYCKRPNHRTRDCWRASKLCLICGQDHLLESCPRYNPHHRSGSAARRTSGLN